MRTEEPHDEWFTSMLCAVCRQPGGSFWRATYEGAPEGGVPVHVGCAKEFYEAIDQTVFGKPAVLP